MHSVAVLEVAPEKPEYCRAFLIISIHQEQLEPGFCFQVLDLREKWIIWRESRNGYSAITALQTSMGYFMRRCRATLARRCVRQ